MDIACKGMDMEPQPKDFRLDVKWRKMGAPVSIFVAWKQRLLPV